MTPTMSALPRLLNCPGSSLLPRAETASYWANLGNDEHEDLAHLGALPPELAKHVPADAKSEVKVAYDAVLRTGRIIGEGNGRSYGVLAPFEIPGSIDVLGVEGDTVIIVDWKTGYADVDPAASNAQLWGYAIAACRALGKDRARVTIVYTKTGRVDSYEIDALELAEFADRLEALFATTSVVRQEGTPIRTREGAWCKHCSSKPYCPSKNALLVQLSGRGLSVVGDATMTPAKAADAVREFVHIEQLVKDAKARIVAYVDEHGPIDMGDGKLYGRYVRKGDERLDGAKTAQAIREVVGEQAKEFESVALERKTSKAALTRAAKAIGKPPKFATLVIDRVRELGGITNASAERPIGEFTQGKEFAAPPPEFPIEEIDRLLAKAG
jgi:hypothetical protein